MTPRRVPALDPGRCVGCDACIELCPDIFRRTEAGWIEVLERDAYDEQCVQEAINCCPSECIGWEEEG